MEATIGLDTRREFRKDDKPGFSYTFETEDDNGNLVKETDYYYRLCDDYAIMFAAKGLPSDVENDLVSRIGITVKES